MGFRDAGLDPDMPGMQHDAWPAEVQGAGVVKAAATGKGAVTLQHEAIAAMGWPAMTMPFKVASPDLLDVAKGLSSRCATASGRCTTCRHVSRHAERR